MPPSGKALKSGYTAPAASNQPHREPFRSGTWRFSEVSTPRARHAVATLRHYLSGRRLHRCGRPAHAGCLAHQTRSVGLGHERAVLFRSRRGRRLSKCLRGHRSLDPGARRTRAWGHRVDDQSGRRRFVAPAGRADSDSIWVAGALLRVQPGGSDEEPGLVCVVSDSPHDKSGVTEAELREIGSAPGLQRHGMPWATALPIPALWRIGGHWRLLCVCVGVFPGVAANVSGEGPRIHRTRARAVFAHLHRRGNSERVGVASLAIGRSDAMACATAAARSA